MIPTLPNFGFGQLIMWIGTTNDHIAKFIWSTIYKMILSSSNSHNKLTKPKLDKVGIIFSIVKDHSPGSNKSIFGHFLPQFACKVDQMWN